MNSSADENRKHAWDAVIRELVAKGEVSEDVIHDSDAIVRWWRSLDSTKQEEITNRVEELSQGIFAKVTEKKTITRTEHKSRQPIPAEKQTKTKTRRYLLLTLALVILVPICLVVYNQISTPTPEPTSIIGSEVGRMAPDFTLTTLDGDSITLSDFRGKTVFINFWATWCGPCRSEMPYIQELYEEQSETGVAILAIDVGENLAEVEEFIRDYSLTFLVLLDMSGTVAEKYNIRAIPTTYFIDSDGIIRDMQIGAFSNVTEIKDILSKIFP